MRPSRSAYRFSTSEANRGAGQEVKSPRDVNRANESIPTLHHRVEATRRGRSIRSPWTWLITSPRCAVSCLRHRALSLVAVIRPAYWTLGQPCLPQPTPTSRNAGSPDRILSESQQPLWHPPILLRLARTYGSARRGSSFTSLTNARRSRFPSAPSPWHGGGWLEDWLVRTGSGVSAPPQLVRYIRWRQSGARYELLTNVLAPARLAAAEALALYPYRWRIERMHFDLKEVLNLNRIYAGNPNAVAMQVYAAGIVYNALRVAQGEVAEAAGLEPEAISPAKFYPKMVAACQTYVVAQQWERRVRRLNPHRRLRMTDWRTERWASVAVPVLHVECRCETRRRRRYCPARRAWKSLAHVRGDRKPTKLS